MKKPYITVGAGSLCELEDLVSKKMEEGYVPTGGVSFVTTLYSSRQYETPTPHTMLSALSVSQHQAMILKKPCASTTLVAGGRGSGKTFKMFTDFISAIETDKESVIYAPKYVVMSRGYYDALMKGLGQSSLIEVKKE